MICGCPFCIIDSPAKQTVRKKAPSISATNLRPPSHDQGTGSTQDTRPGDGLSNSTAPASATDALQQSTHRRALGERKQVQLRLTAESFTSRLSLEYPHPPGMPARPSSQIALRSAQASLQPFLEPVRPLSISRGSDGMVCGAYDITRRPFLTQGQH